jgi:hypothetical protein
MDVGYRQTQLPKYYSGLGFSNSTFLDEVVKKFPSGAKLCNKPYVILGSDDFIQLSDMGVVKLTVVVDFPRQSGRN